MEGKDELLFESKSFVMQSLYLSYSRYTFSVLEKKILYLIIKELNKRFVDGYISGRRLCNEGNKDEWHGVTVKIKISDVIGKSRNRAAFCDAVHNLINHPIEVPRSPKNFDYGEMVISNIISKSTINITDGYCDFEISDELAEMAMNMVSGYSKYDLNVVFKLRSIYSMRILEIISFPEEIKSTGEYKKMIFPFHRFVFMLGIGCNSGMNTNDIKRKIINKAKEELDSKSPFSFNVEYTKDKIDRRKVSTITLTPIKTPGYRSIDSEEHKKFLALEKKYGQEIMDMLFNIGFYRREIATNKTIHTFIKYRKELLPMIAKKINEVRLDGFPGNGITRDKLVATALSFMMSAIMGRAIK